MCLTKSGERERRKDCKGAVVQKIRTCDCVVARASSFGFDSLGNLEPFPVGEVCSFDGTENKTSMHMG